METKTHYGCKNCGSTLDENVNTLSFCKCGKIGVDRTLNSIRILGDLNFLNVFTKTTPIKVYRIVHLSTGLFYKPSVYRSKSNFSKKGKIYTKKPDLKWVSSKYRNDCIIQEYSLTR
jgi:hypothetical protein